MSRYAISKVDLITHPVTGRTVRAPVLLPYLFSLAGEPLGWSEFHIDDSKGWCLCRLDGGFRAVAMAADADVELLPDESLTTSIVSRLGLRRIRQRLGVEVSVDDDGNWRDLLNRLGRELGSGFDVERWGAAR